MSRRINRFWIATVALVMATVGTSWYVIAQPEGAKLNAGKIGAAADSKATTTPHGVVRLGWARTDVKVAVDGMPYMPAAGLGS